MDLFSTLFKKHKININTQCQSIFKKPRSTQFQRYEYLGDSIFNTIVSIYLYGRYKTQNEGFLTQLRTKIINNKSMENYTKNLPLLSFIPAAQRIGKKSFANYFEVLFGIMFDIEGFEKVRKFVFDFLESDLFNWPLLLNQIINAKQKLYMKLKRYQLNVKDICFRVTNKESFQEKHLITVTIKYKNIIIGIGTGFGKKDAEKIAAENALQKCNQSFIISQLFANKKELN